MICQSRSFEVATHGQGTYPITAPVQDLVAGSGVGDGVATVLLAHTSASLVIYENADPTARQDLLAYFRRLVPEGDPLYRHTAEGPDDATSHLRMALTRTSEVIPISQGRLCLGTWQGLFIFEHRQAPHRRTIWVNIVGQDLTQS